MTTTALEAPPVWRELDEQAMAWLEGGGPFAEFVYDATHTVVSAVKSLYDLRPQPSPTGGGGGGAW